MHRGKDKYFEFSVFIKVLRHKLFLLFKKGMAEHFPAISAGTGSSSLDKKSRALSSKAVSGNGADQAQLTVNEEESLSFTVDSTFGQACSGFGVKIQCPVKHQDGLGEGGLSYTKLGLEVSSLLQKCLSLY